MPKLEETLRDTTDASGPWYPGKYAKVALSRLAVAHAQTKAAKARGEFEKPKHPVLALRNALFKKRRPLATRGDDDDRARARW